MNNSLLKLTVKEFKVLKRGGFSLFGLFIYSILFVFLLCFTLRELGVVPEEIAVVSFSGLWLVTLFIAFRLSLQSCRVECERGIFGRLLETGFSADAIFFSKVLVGMLVLVFLFSINYSLFVFLIGFPSVLNSFLSAYVVFLIAIPGLVLVSYLGALMSLLSLQEEILMAVTVVPLSLYYGVLVVNEAERAYRNSYFELNSDGILIYLGFSVVLALISPILCRYIFNSSRVI